MNTAPSQYPPVCNGLPLGAGVGLKRQLVSPLLANPTSVDFIEVHAENYMSGSRQLEMLQDLGKTWPVSVHGVALSLGGEDPLDMAHLSGSNTFLIPSSRRAFQSISPGPATTGSISTTCYHSPITPSRLSI